MMKSFSFIRFILVRYVFLSEQILQFCHFCQNKGLANIKMYVERKVFSKGKI